MREIKFRVWDNVNKYFHEIESINIAKNNMPTNIVTTTGKIYQIQKPSQIILSQFTGLKDKNGTEIYEGDILSDWPGSNYEVYFHKNGFWVIDKANPFPIESGLDDIKFMIIGNIYENPELISNSNSN